MKRSMLPDVGYSIAVLAMAGLAFGAGHALGDGDITFNRDIRPILTENCFACHGADSASREADLRLDLRDPAVDYGAIVPGDADSSSLIERIRTDDPDLVMPPPETKKQLTAEQQRLLETWVKQGAEYQAHWSYLPPERQQTPAVDSEEWARNAIDHFILARLKQEGLTPAPEAAPHVIFRRIHLDITGLPPEPDDVKAFESDYQNDKEKALSDWIDRLMQRKAWGEHRARYWLDAARYADTHGVHYDNYREMWPYRDWVIRSFNANQPFDEFTVEQLAGDLLENPSVDQLVATGFQRCNITTNEGGTIAEENLANYAVDRVQTFGWVYLGLTTNCAQCHDHKFDPITMRDYYSLAAFFRNTKAPALDGNTKDGAGPVIAVPTEEDRPRWNALKTEIEESLARRDTRREAAGEAFKTWLATTSPEALDERIASDGLKVHLPLNEGAGSRIENRAKPSEDVDNPNGVDWQLGGKLGPAPVFNRHRTLAVGQAGDFDKDQAFSFGCWMKSANTNTQGSVLARMDSAAKYRGWDIWLNGNGTASVHLIDAWDGNAIKVTTRDKVISANNWLHLFATYDGSGKASGVRIYVDGESKPTKADKDSLKPDATIVAATPLRVGQRSGGQEFVGGSVQDVRVYDRLLASDEIQSLLYLPALQTLLATPEAKRSDEAIAQGFADYLTAIDPEYQVLARELAKLETERDAIRKRSPITHIQEEKPNSTPMASILMRGEYDRPGEEVTAAPPAALHPLPPGVPLNRLGLAQWVVDPANPLTARVTVNRFWRQLFGEGIVPTAEDFGVSGSLPSHPELLDWLAIEFQQSDWDVKHMYKLMLMSATYRQSAATTLDKLEVDPANTLLSRGPRFRMDAEMVRDLALATSDLLSPRMYGPGTKPYQPDDLWNIVGLPGGNTRKYVQDKGENLYRRTVYNFWKRMAPPPNLEAFNAPSREVCTVRRERTNTPLQALVTLNDPQFVEAARRLAEHANADNDKPEAILDFIAMRVLSRSLTAAEQSLMVGAYEQFLSYYESKPDDATALLSVGDSKVDVPENPASLAAWSMVASQFINLDEALNK